MRDIQSEPAVFLPSAQTFINITSQPTGRPTSNLKKKKEMTSDQADRCDGDQP